MSRENTDQPIIGNGLEFTPAEMVWVREVQAYYTRVFAYDEGQIEEIARLKERLWASVPLSLTCGDYYLGPWGPSGQDVYLLGGIPTIGVTTPCVVCGERQTFNRKGRVYCVPCGGYTNGDRHE
jgi:hypothetical protein